MFNFLNITLILKCLCKIYTLPKYSQSKLMKSYINFQRYFWQVCSEVFSQVLSHVYSQFFPVNCSLFTAFFTYFISFFHRYFYRFSFTGFLTVSLSQVISQVFSQVFTCELFPFHRSTSCEKTCESYAFHRFFHWSFHRFFPVVKDLEEKARKELKARVQKEQLVAKIEEYGGLWKSKEEMEGKLNELNVSEKEKVAALQAQIQFRKKVLGAVHPDKKVF